MAAKKTAAKKTTTKKRPPGECYAGDGREVVATVLTAFGPRNVCQKHADRAKAAGRVVR